MVSHDVLGSDAGPPVDVVLLRRPGEEVRPSGFGRSAPRLLLVGEERAASIDPLEDWIRLPAAEDDLRARVSTLAARAGLVLVTPTVDADGLLRYRGRG